jgi:hypothetical protein
MTKSKWNKNDDILLLELTELYGQNWTYIASKIAGRTAEDVMHRFILKLDPELKRSKFDKEEDELIIKLHEKYGNKWNEITKYFPKRSSAMVKNRYYSHLKTRDSYTCETTSDYSKTTMSKERHTHSHNYNKNLLTDCDIDMLDHDLNTIHIRIDPNINLNYNCSTPNLDHNLFNNYIPNSLYNDENSPKLKSLESNEAFDEHYNNIFNKYKKKDSYENKLQDEYYVKQNNLQNENENLFKQFLLLENIFKKVYELSTNNTIKTGIYALILDDENINLMNKKLEEKKDNLSIRLFNLKEDYLRIISTNVNDNEIIKNSLIVQIKIMT